MTLKLAHLILTFDGLTFELTFEHSVIKSLTLEMALQNRDSGIKSRTKAYRPNSRATATTFMYYLSTRGFSTNEQRTIIP